MTKDSWDERTLLLLARLALIFRRRILRRTSLRCAPDAYIPLQSFAIAYTLGAGVSMGNLDMVILAIRLCLNWSRR